MRLLWKVWLKAMFHLIIFSDIISNQMSCQNSRPLFGEEGASKFVQGSKIKSAAILLKGIPNGSSSDKDSNKAVREPQISPGGAVTGWGRYYYV